MHKPPDGAVMSSSMPPDPVASDTELIASLLRSRDAAAFSELVRRHSTMVYAVCRRVLGRADLAQDAVQETFIQLLRKPEAVGSSVAGWLHRVALRKALDLRRHELALQRRHQRSPRVKGEAHRPEPGGWADAVLAELPEDQRHLLVRYYLEGSDQATLAAELDCTQPTVSRRLRQAVEALRCILSQRGITAGLTMIVTALRAHTGEAMPPRCVVQLGRLALVGRARPLRSRRQPPRGRSGWAIPAVATASCMALLGWALGARVTPPASAPSPDPPTTALVHYRFDERSGNVVRDRGRGRPLDLLIAAPRHVRWGLDGLELLGPAGIGSPIPATKLSRACRKSGEVTVAVWLEPTLVAHPIEARVVSLSGGYHHRNFALQQGEHGRDMDAYAVRIRVHGSDDNGVPALATRAASSQRRLTHLVFVHGRDGHERIWIDGTPTIARPAGPLDDWEEGYRLLLGDEAGGGRDWRGRLLDLRIDDAAWSAEAVAAAYRAGPSG